MFIPFLPFIVMYAALSALGTSHGMGGLTLTGAAALATYLVPPLAGIAAWSLPRQWQGRNSVLGLSPARLLHMGLWLVLASLTPAHGALAAAFKGLPAANEWAALAMLLNYWFSDALALSSPWTRQIGRSPGDDRGWWRELGGILRLSVPVLALLGIITGGMTAVDSLPASTAVESWPWWAISLGTLVLYLGVMGVMIPPLIRFGWGLRPLQSAEADELIRRELAANGVSVSALLAWPEHLMRYATAGVIGLLPGFRYLLFGDSLIRACTPGEIGAITAHEAAHIRHRHLWYYLMAIGTVVIVLQAVLNQVLMAGLLMGIPVSPGILVVAEIGAILLFLRFGLGALSRNFERQADANALNRWGLEHFRGAMAKVAALNGISIEQRNWHHFGIAQRIAYLEQASREPDLLHRHNRHVARIKGMLAVGLLAALAVQAVFSGPNIVGFVAERYWQDRLGQGAEPTPEALRAVQFLGARAHQRGDWLAARRYFRQWLVWFPDDPLAQNNLGWILVTDEEGSTGDLREGLVLALRAARARNAAFIWDTVAEAFQRNGRPMQAMDAAARALKLAREGRGLGEASLDFYQDRWRKFKLAGNPERSP